jgi:hypothetical protein
MPKWREYQSLRLKRASRGGRPKTGLTASAPPIAAPDFPCAVPEPETLNQIFLGDPVRGRSALDKMREMA